MQAPSEAEAQAAFIVKQNDAFAIGSQDADSLLFGAPRTVRNLTFSGKRRTGAAKYVVVKPEMIDLKENLAHLGITQRQLITLSMLVGTDYNHGGIPGIGPKKALQLVKKYGTNFDEMFASVDWQAHFSYPWQEVFDTFMNIPIEKNYSWKPQNPDRRTILSLLIEKHGFSEERVLSLLDPYLEFCKKRQKGLGEFFG
ncbi:hypothetical protein HYV81_03965 [Candidatus Woesearchaeota archaeon]|nr:hypothetical protein [Candidatus Woesearchaeota archaeon]